MNAASKSSYWDILVKAQSHLAFDTSIEAATQRDQIASAFVDLDEGRISPRTEATVLMAEVITKEGSW
jgi:hypothetical protein